MIVVGLTGSIAMGKSTVAQIFASLGAPVFDADLAVREFYRSPGVAALEASFPGVNRERLAAATLGDPEALARLERIVHPEVGRLRQAFLERARAQGRRVVILDVPLLFETGGEKAVDLALVVSAGEAVQRARALARAGMSAAKLEAILARQASDAEKRRRAHFVIDTNSTLEQTRAQAAGVLRAIAAMTGGRNLA